MQKGPASGIQAGHRFVQDQDIRIQRHNSSQSHPLFLSSAQMVRRFFRQMTDSEKLQTVPGPPVSFLIRQSHLPWAESDLVVNSPVEQHDIRILEQVTYLFMKSLRCTVVLQILFCDDRAFKHISAGIRKGQTVEESEQSRFSGPVISSDSKACSLFDLQGKIIYDRHLFTGISIGDIPQFHAAHL